MSIIVGIDLGTTNSVLSYMKLGKPIIAENKGDKIIPSVVSIKEDGEVIVGKLAKNLLPVKHDRTIAEIKRKMGTDEVIIIDDIEYSPQQISSLILKELKDFSELYIGEEVNEAVITVPANFNNKQRQATIEAANLAGLSVKRLLNEPTAAALAYGYEDLNREGNMLVYDLGGGTFDVSILELSNGLFDVKASEGNMKLGGSDFDERLMNYLINHIEKDTGINLHDNNIAKKTLKQEAEDIKINLSYSDKVDVFIPALRGTCDEFGMPICVDLTIDRETFENLIKDLVDKTKEIIEKAINNANLDDAEIDMVLVVGGSTKMPIIRDLLIRRFGDRVKFDLNPDEVVSNGASILGSLDNDVENDYNEFEEDTTEHEQEDKVDIIVTDICPYTIGVEIVAKEDGALIPGKFDRLINKNTTIPTYKKEIYCTVKDNQEKVNIKVFQGEDDFVENNIHIGTLEINNIPEGTAGEQEIEVMFIYEENGTLNIEATILSTGKKANAKFLEPDEEDLPEETKELLKKASDAMNKTWPQKKIELQQCIDCFKKAIKEKEQESIEKYEKLITDIVFEIEFVDMNESITK